MKRSILIEFLLLVWTIQYCQANSIIQEYAGSYVARAFYPTTFFPNQVRIYNQPKQAVNIETPSGYEQNAGPIRSYVQPIVYQYHSIGSNLIQYDSESPADPTGVPVEIDTLVDGSGDQNSISETVVDDVIVESTTQETVDTTDVAISLLEGDGLLAQVEQTTIDSAAVEIESQTESLLSTLLKIENESTTLSPDVEKSTLQVPTTTPAVPALLPFYLRPVDYRRADPARYFLPSPYGYQLHGPVNQPHFRYPYQYQ